MRPVNLIPAEERRGEHAAMRSGPLAYIAVAMLVAALAGVTALVLTGNEIADRKAEVTQLRREDAAARARAQRLAAYTEFKDLHDQRVATVVSLADSRFDWERVMRELSLVLPPDVWLTNLNATAAPGVKLEGGTSGGSSSSAAGLRSAIAGPALEMSGCAAGQDAVAGFVTALKDIDGVTRVGVQSSALPQEGGGAAVSTESSGGGGGESDCRTRGFIAQFEIVAAFDAAPVPVGVGGEEEEAAPPPVEESSEESATESTPTSAEG
jgi:Tfp pilus assembly protein PilN